MSSSRSRSLWISDQVSFSSNILRFQTLSSKTAHGTYIGSIRLEGHKPTQLQLDSMFSFGASTRKYILRERPNATIPLGSSLLDDMQMEGGEGALLGLPESQTELDVSYSF